MVIPVFVSGFSVGIMAKQVTTLRIISGGSRVFLGVCSIGQQTPEITFDYGGHGGIGTIPTCVTTVIDGVVKIPTVVRHCHVTSSLSRDSAV